MNQFNQMSLPLALEKALEGMDFSVPTPIQAQSIPLALQRKDIIGCAQTGTGKTAAFSIPIVERLLAMPKKTALILAPTRELAVQIADVLKDLTAAAPELRLSLLIGGLSLRQQLKSLQASPRIVIATPGRLMDHLRRRSLSLSQVEILVLDEADRMLDMGFLPQLNEILRFLPADRQTLLFSATLPDNIQKLANRFLRNPSRVSVGVVSQPVAKIQQSVVQTTMAQKNDVLLDELNARKGSVLIFARTKSRTDRVAKYLAEYGYSVTRLHGDRSQGQRNAAIQGFREGTFRILVATDIAARGLDIPHIAHVINYDLPQAPEDYVHRIGRTARAGAEGQSLSLLLPDDQAQWQRICRLYQIATPAGMSKSSAPMPVQQKPRRNIPKRSWLDGMKKNLPAKRNGPRPQRPLNRA